MSVLLKGVFSLHHCMTQIIGMLLHRTSTFLHIMATTETGLSGVCRRGGPDDKQGKISVNDAVAFAEKLGRITVRAPDTSYTIVECCTITEVYQVYIEIN